VSGSGKGLVVFDYDNDGDQDIFAVNNGGEPVLLRNDTENENDWLRIALEGVESNRDGIGAKITVTADLDDPLGLIYREVDGGSNFLGQNEFITHIGLGVGDEAVDLIEILWPSGQKDVFTNVDRNTLLRAVEGATVPEPASLVLAGVGGLALANRRRRRA